MKVTVPERGGIIREGGAILPPLTAFETVRATFAAVRSVKLCALSAHTTITEK